MQPADLRQRRNRSNLGQTTSEFVPVFMFFMLVIFFPMLDMIAMAALYGCGMILNAEQAREASMVANRGTTGGAETTAVTDATAERLARVRRVQTEWAKNGFGHFFKIKTPITDPLISITTDGAGANADQYVHVTTTIAGDPFLNIPFPLTVQGLNSPMTFTYSQERLIEQ